MITKGYAIIDLKRDEPYVPRIWEKKEEAKAELWELLRYMTNKEWKRRLIVRAYEGNPRNIKNRPTKWIRPIESGSPETTLETTPV